MVGPAAKREAVAHLRERLQMSERRACAVIAADRKMIRYQSRRPPERALRARLRDLANERRRFGYRRLFILLRREGEPSGINRIYRLYREEGLGVRKRKGRKRAIGVRAPILVEARPNARWSLDFVHDQMANGRRFRILNITDDVTHECLGSIPDTSISGQRVARELTAIIAPGQARNDCFRQWHRADFPCHLRLGQGSPHRLALHHSGQAHAERLCRELQWQDARRAPERDPILRSRPGLQGDRRMGRRLQYIKTTLGSELPDTGSLCCQADRNRPLRCAI
jgi:putative transposase